MTFTPPLTLGIEEEYMIIDPETRELTSYVQEMLNRGSMLFGQNVKAAALKRCTLTSPWKRSTRSTRACRAT